LSFIDLPKDFLRKPAKRLKILEKIKIAVIGGTGFKDLFKNHRLVRLGTPYRIAPSVSLGKIGEKEVAFLPRHGRNHSTPPHKVNYRANIYSLYKIGVERIIAINAVGAINRELKPGNIIIPHDFIDFTKLRDETFYDENPVTHVDVSQPYCPELRKILTENSRKLGLPIRDKAVMVCTEGPRFETPAEIEMFRRLGCDIVGMTSVPEAILARELEICYAALCFVSNMATGIQEQLTLHEVPKVSEKIMPKIEQVLMETINSLPIERQCKCPCVNALRNARIK
jgi:5'-methylthioadenosine phosphorylase